MFKAKIKTKNFLDEVFIPLEINAEELSKNKNRFQTGFTPLETNVAEFRKDKNRFLTGFTLVEMVVAVAIFSMVMVMVMGALLAVINANKQNQAIQTAVNNLSLSLETLSREMRVGSRYHCGSSGTITDPQNCPTVNGSDYISFLSFEGNQIVYQIYIDPVTGNKRIQRSDDGGANFLFLTSPVVFIEKIVFYISGADPTDDIQPRALITISGYVDLGSVGDRGKSYFDLQTTASQRMVDF